MTDLPIYIQIGVTAICAVAYVWTFRYQSAKISSLETLISNQSSIINDFEKYKSLFDIDDFEKRLSLKLENQHLELSKDFNSKIKGIVDQTIKVSTDQFIASNKEIIQGWEELCQIAMGVALDHYPQKEMKADRDKWIKDYHPKNAKWLIGFIDNHFEKSPGTSQKKSETL
jgi:calcineurin-like phosphoesterase family protein